MVILSLNNYRHLCFKGDIRGELHVHTILLKMGLLKGIFFHVIETDLSMMVRAYLPLSLWSKAFQAVTYLINRLSFSVLDSKTPFELLCTIQPSYDHLRVFGCICYLNTRLYVATKLDVRLVLCFFCYPHHQKG